MHLKVCMHMRGPRLISRYLIIEGGGQPNLTQFMPIPHSNLKIGIGINWVKLARTGVF